MAPLPRPRLMSLTSSFLLPFLLLTWLGGGGKRWGWVGMMIRNSRASGLPLKSSKGWPACNYCRVFLESSVLNEALFSTLGPLE